MKKINLFALGAIVILAAALCVGCSKCGNNGGASSGPQRDDFGDPTMGMFLLRACDGGAEITGFTNLAGNTNVGGDIVVPPRISVDGKEAAPVVKIGENAFKKTELTGVTIPEGVLKIDDSAFEDCDALAEVELPASLKEIDEEAFNDCDVLTTIAIPAGVEKIGAGAFAGCKAMTAITVDEANATYVAKDGVLFTKDGTTLVAYPAGKADAEYAVPAGVTTIAPRAFDDAKTLTSVALPDGLTTIGEKAFDDCDGIKTIAIPASVTEIGVEAFPATTEVVK